jgi:hypothetical protein
MIPRGSNVFEATCARCGLLVAPGKGLVSGKTGVNWRVVHDTCIPVYQSRLPAPRPWIKDLEYDL